LFSEKRKKGILRLLELSGSKKGHLLVSGVFSSVSAVLMLIPYMSVYFILKELLINAHDLTQLDSGLLYKWGFIAFGGLVAGFILLYVGSMASHIAAFKILYSLRMSLSRHLGKLPLGYLSKTSTGKVKKTLEQNVEKIELFIAHQIPDMVSAIVTVIMMGVVMAYLNVWMFLACVAILVAAFVSQVLMVSGSSGENTMKAYHDALERISGSAIQYVRGMPAVKVFGQTVHSFKKFHKDMTDYRDLSIRWTDEFQNGFVAFKTLLASVLILILPVGVYLLSKTPENMKLSLDLLFFIVLAPGMASPVYKLMYLGSNLRDIGECTDRIDSIFEEKSLPQLGSFEHPQNFDVEFENVYFSYDSVEVSTRSLALANLSFKAKQGKMTALVGPSGSGKSTIAYLIPRFWDADQGKVKIGGVDIRKIETEELMDTVAFVFQDSFLFYDTIYENIKIGNPGATGKEVIAAAKAAQCHEFIEKLPDGYDTLIGEGGTYLSGGEEQRVSVARAILKNAPILILDEATAFADPENEHKMQLALQELMRGKTVIIIAHRLSTIQEADNIVVLNNGELIEMGKHGNLVSEGGTYARMWDAFSNASAWSLKKEGCEA